MRTQVPSLALLSGLKIWRDRDLWCRSKMRLKSGVAVAVAWASSYSSDSTPCLGISIWCRCGAKKTKKKKKMMVRWKTAYFLASFNILFFFFLMLFFRATPAAYGDSQASGWIGAIATGLCHNHSNTGSELCLWPIPQLMATPDP